MTRKHRPEILLTIVILLGLALCWPAILLLAGTR